MEGKRTGESARGKFTSVCPPAALLADHHLRAQLYAEDDGYKEPIARFARSRKSRETGTATPATLVFTARALQIRDDVVISFLFLERSRRTDETNLQNYADVMSTPALSAVTGSDYNVRDGGV